MKLEMRTQMRLEQQMKLAPHMIQSMEILQLPILALQERIEQELNSNPVLEIEEPPGAEDSESYTQQLSEDINRKDFSSGTTGEKGEDFGRIESLDDDYKEYMDRSGPFRGRIISDEPDKKLEALKNTAARSQSLHEYLTEQWGLVEASEAVKKAGSTIIDYIDERGYLSVRLEQLHNKDRKDFSFEDLEEALVLVQRLEPTGVGARDLKECLLIQMAQNAEDMRFEEQLIGEHMEELLENRLPEIAKKMNCKIEDLNRAIERISKFDTSPGLQIGREQNHPVTADVIVERMFHRTPHNGAAGCHTTAEDSSAGCHTTTSAGRPTTTEDYLVRLADYDLPVLRISDYYAQMAKDEKINEKTRKFLQGNIRSAKWIMDAIEQRKNTLLRVARSVVKHQKEFFDKGQLYLKPLPMSRVADEVGVHLATVSRAVAGKYVQCYWGVLPLRKFFSGGMEDISGNTHSWEAIRAKLQQIIDNEDKSRPLSDDKLKEKLAEEAGLENLARRTVAKYRKLLNIPAARFRKKY
jgi:RNA polymerase sigma-54 factor